MPDLELHGVPLIYETVGDGFPLLLMPGADGTATVWEQYIPLLAELCRTITYTVPAAVHIPALELLGAFLDALELERIYLACQVDTWSLAVQYALRAMKRLEGMLFLGTGGAGPRGEMLPRMALPSLHFHTITVPALVLLEEQCVAALPEADVLTAYLPRSVRVVVATADTGSATAVPSLRLGHALMSFLLHCERQRNLVRGASFLL